LDTETEGGRNESLERSDRANWKNTGSGPTTNEAQREKDTTTMNPTEYERGRPTDNKTKSQTTEHQ
jgi:hypothetical protein